MIRIRKVLGVRGINHNRESARAVKWSYFFDTILVLILLWLPIQWYLQKTGQLSSHIVSIFDWIIWLAFASETTVITMLVKHKRAYLQENWLNLFVIVFAFPPIFLSDASYFVFLRYFRLVIILRLASVQFHFVYRILRLNRFGTTLFAFLIITLLSGMIASYVDPSIGTPWNGMWWAFQTVTTVGYGDVVPHTIFGKIFACILMVMGVALVSVVSANFVAFLIGGNQKQKVIREMKNEYQKLTERLESLEEANRTLLEEIRKRP